MDFYYQYEYKLFYDYGYGEYDYDDYREPTNAEQIAEQEQLIEKWEKKEIEYERNLVAIKNPLPF